MRSWNKCCAFSNESFMRGSQFTNEELKLSEDNIVEFDANSSQFTNEELKQARRKCIACSTPCSQFTNEELKLFFFFHFLNLLSCSQFTNEELKHIFICETPPFPFQFAIYQWGVETSFVMLCGCGGLCKFAIYQWGVESLNFKSYGFGLGKNL